MAYAQNNHKVAIPKIDRPPPPPKGPDRNREDRVTRACKTCRKRKVKCSGDIPRCLDCQISGLKCIYEQARRDRLKEATDLNHTFVALFAELSAKLSEEDRRRIQDVIHTAEDDMMQPHPTPSARSLGKRVRGSSFNSSSPDSKSPVKENGEAQVTASVGSNEDLDFLDEDLLRTRQSRETGYFGQNSEVQWLRTFQRQVQSQDTEPCGLPYGPPGASKNAAEERSEALHQRRERSYTSTRHITDATFYLDSDSIELDIIVNPYELPTPGIAEHLLNCYMSTVHSSFPILPSSFEDQVRRFIESLMENRPFQVPDRWRALLNLTFAVGAKYSHLIGADWQGDERDHLMYMTRASHLLGMHNTVMLISNPDLSLVQATAILSLYFLVIGRVSRAWLMVGISIRLGLALGLHLRNEDPNADETTKEMLLRTWWSLHSIECLVSTVTGRPPVIANEDCTVPLPKILPGDLRYTSEGFQRPSKRKSRQSLETNSYPISSHDAGQYLIGTISISLLTQKVLTQLYAPRTAVHSWQEIQVKIKGLLSDLEGWAAESLSEHHMQGSPKQSRIAREQLLLWMSYWSTKILITRPCLCRTERRIKNESGKSAHFNSEMAETCIKSARALTALFPDEPDIDFIYGKAPWWNTVHIIMQCTAVLLLEVAYQGGKTEKNSDQITRDIQKMINCLRTMQDNDPVAGRAYQVVQKILHNTDPALHAKTEELLQQGSTNHQTADGKASEHLGSLYQQQPGPGWAPGESFNGLISVDDHQHHVSEQATGQDQIPGPSSSYDPSMHPSFPTAPFHVPSTFSNPFNNSWDEGLPVVDMHNLWPMFNYSNYPEDLGDMNLLDLYMEPQQSHEIGETSKG
ncbi:DNA binding [Ascochyta rabiei]|uniref:DNA binding n=1 Tax=Didymella rabiei TaxID=5454 RepID=A0A162YS60_DIDRA|nr:DNA binding [Ascochyta rabiei]